MLTLIHGDDTSASRNYYFDVKQIPGEKVTLDGVSVSPTDLQQVISGEDLFGTKKHVFIENLISKRKSSKDIESLVGLILASGADVTLWESKELTPKQVGLLKGANVKVFKIPATIFALLDALKPNNGKQLIELFHKTLADKEAEFVLVMLQRQVRILLALSSVIPAKAGTQNKELDPGSQSGMTISELSRMQPWQKGKLEKQAKLFTIEQLVQLHTSLFDLELGMKTGGLTQSLENEIDLFLLQT